MADNQPFAQYLADVKKSAAGKGVGEQVLVMLDNLKPDPRVLKFDRKQPEFTQTFEQYLQARVTKYRIDTANKYYADHAVKLEEIANTYSVDAEYILSFWGLESNFGQYQGKYSIVRSLATLGHDPRRAKFFTKELINALVILDQGHIAADKFVGGWAGAMGQNQFMPSSFLVYAEDFDGDGKKNIWSNQVDVWASIANYLSTNGWHKGQGWGLAVALTEEIEFESLRPAKVRKGCRAYRHHTGRLSLDEWRNMGVDVAPGSEKYAMVIPAKGETKAYLVGRNFGGILAYNCANKYAVSIGLLADQIKR
ncbi:MAG: lytic murein transglycosylase [Pseudomonadales bacterium]|nr:lytic murein transglycosylase [Pseudomonadales bacterium]